MFHLEMDFHSLSRKELQALCKRNKIPANLTNIAMADALQSLPQVEGLDELNNAPKSDNQQSPERSIPGSPELPPTASRTTTRTRRAPRRITEEENKNVNLLDTPAMPTSRRRAPATSTRKKAEAKVQADAVMVTPVAQSSRRRAPAASGQGKMGAQEEGKSVQKVYGKRQSMRLLEKTMGGLSLTGNGNFEAVKLENDVDENKPDSGEGSETTRDSELYRNLDQSLENETEVSNGLQEEKNKSSENEVDACSQNWESASQKSKNRDRLSGIDGEDVDSGKNTNESVFQVDISEKANMSHGVIDENGSDVLNSVESFTVESGSEKDLSIDQSSSAVKSEEDSSAIAMEMEQTSIEKAQDEVSAEIMDNILPAQTSTPSKIDNNPVTSSEVNFVDTLLPKPYENLSDEVEEYENLSEDVENDKSENSEESEDNMVEDDVTEKEESDMFADSAIKVAPKMQENVGSDENLIDVQVTDAADLPSTLSKTPTSTKQMNPYQPLVAGETVQSPFAQSSTPSKIDNNPVTSSEVNFVDTLLPKPYENLSDEVEEYENLSEDVENDKSESSEESEDNMVEDDVTEKEDCDMFADSAIKVAPKMQENVGSDENLIDVQVTDAADLPSTLSKTPTSTKQMSPYQPLVAGETVQSPFAADTLQGQFPRPSGLTPKNTSAKTQITVEMMMSQASSVNKENIHSSGMKVEARKDDMKSTAVDKEITVEPSLRALRKMLKQKLNVSDKNDHEEIVKKEGKARPALQRVPENGMVTAEEAETKN